VIERGGMRFGVFGVLGKEAQIYTSGAAASFSDAIETTEEMVKVLRETEKVDVVIALSHGGVEKGEDGRYSDGDDVRVANVPGVDIVIGGHSHTELHEAIMVNGRTPVVQTGLQSRNLGVFPSSFRHLHELIHDSRQPPNMDLPQSRCQDA
jgi:5'-nucleotidase